MTDHTPAETRPDAPATEILPDFAPVPRAAERSNGWKPEVQRAFIEALAETGSVKAACRRVNRADHGAYLLRRHPEAQEFRHAWDIALDIGMRRIEDVAMDRAINGVEVPMYVYGKLVGTRTVYNDRLLMFMLRNRAPDRFAGGKPKALNALDQATLKKRKAEWHKEWERERAIAETEEADTTGDDFIEMIVARHVRWWAGLSPRARAAYIAFRRIESEDRHYLWQDEEDPEDILADYEQVFADDRGAPVDKLEHSDGIGDEAVLGEDLPAEPPLNRMITLKDGGWSIFREGNDGRCTPM